MTKLGINDVINYATESIPRTKRFSKLSSSELANLWRDTTSHINQQVSNSKSVMFPGVGAFYVRKIKTALSETKMPCFVPGKAWVKVPGYRSTAPTVTGSHAAEPLNFAAVAGISGLNRDEVEPGLKDIVHALVLVLKRGTSVSLVFSDMGRLSFHNREVKFCFNADFLEVVACGLPAVPEDRDQASSGKDTGALQSGGPCAAAASASPSPPVAPSDSSAATGDDKQSVAAQVQEQVPTVVPSQQAPSVAAATDAKQQEIDEIERLAILLTTRAGNRLWSNAKCPICRQHANGVVTVETNTAMAVETAVREKTHDRMLLQLSLAGDRAYMRNVMAYEDEKIKAAVATAKYNYTEAMTQEVKRKTEKKNLPLGNMFENRDPGPDRVLQAKELKAGLHDQMTIKRCIKMREKAKKEAEDRELNERLLKEFKTAEVQTHLDKLRRRQAQQDALAQQMVAQDASRKREAVLEPMTENSFARSETLMFLYQKEKARQLYQEQLAILKQRREYEMKVAEMEKMHSLERLALSRKELQKDIQTIKQSNYLTRKGLENTWGVQRTQQKIAQEALGY